MRYGLSILSLLVLFLQGCTTSVTAPPYDAVDGFQGVPADSRLLVVPVTANNKLYQPGRPVVAEMLEQELDGNYQVFMLEEGDFQRYWAASAQQVGGFFSPVDGTFDRQRYLKSVRLFAKQLNPDGRYDLILFPALVDRTAESKGRYAHWDGVRRRHSNKGMQLADARWHGKTRGLSLELNAFDGAGEWAFTTYGGLVLPYYYSMDGRVPETHIKKTLFAETDHIHNGVSVAVRQFAASQPLE